MLSKQITHYSSKDARDALSGCLEESLTLKKNTTNLSVFVQDISKAEDQWKATAKVILSPKPKARTKPQPKPSPNRKKKAEPQEQFSLQNKLKRDKELEHIKQKEKLEYQHLMEGEDARQHRQNDLILKSYLDIEEESFTHLYLEIAYESLHQEIERNLGFSHVHYIATNSLWDAVQKYHPDLDMHEAAHNVEVLKYKPATPEQIKRIKKAEPENCLALVRKLTRT